MPETTQEQLIDLQLERVRKYNLYRYLIYACYNRLEARLQDLIHEKKFEEAEKISNIMSGMRYCMNAQVNILNGKKDFIH